MYWIKFSVHHKVYALLQIISEYMSLVLVGALCSVHCHQPPSMCSSLLATLKLVDFFSTLFGLSRSSSKQQYVINEPLETTAPSSQCMLVP